MGKAEKGTAKYLANKMKAKGLQKLRWYCQMCQKQCRDENGFKCHTMSEGHQRQILLFADNPDKYLDSFSEDFYKDYLSLLKRRFGTKRVHANNVYQEYIHDRDHIHMNATQWETLTEFVKWLGREGYCTVDETEKGWYVAYIDRDPETLLRQEKLAKKEKHEIDDEERNQAFLERQIQLGLERAKNMPETVFTDLKRDGEDPIKLNLSISSKKSIPSSSSLASLSDKLKGQGMKPPAPKKPDSVSKKRSALDEIMEEEKRKKIRQAENEALANAALQVNEEPWLFENIVVKVITKELGSKYYKVKGVVTAVVNEYAARIRLIECGTKMKLDQKHIETVIPSIGRTVLILTGRHRGCKAELMSLQQDKFSATLKLLDTSKIIEGVPYEQFSKLHVVT